jgi:hypothetical protein
MAAAGKRRCGEVKGVRPRAWLHRDFLPLWSAQGISAVGSRITRTALPMAAILAIDASARMSFLAVALSLPGVGGVVRWRLGTGIAAARR